MRCMPVSTSSSISMKQAANAAGWPLTGRLSFATPTRPVPASAVAEACVIGLMSSRQLLAVELAAQLDGALRGLARSVSDFEGLPCANTLLPSMS